MQISRSFVRHITRWYPPSTGLPNFYYQIECLRIAGKELYDVKFHKVPFRLLVTVGWGNCIYPLFGSDRLGAWWFLVRNKLI